VPERNPYLILGVDFGASSDEARRAFAHAARRIRRSGGVWDVEDLNWALHEVEALESNPADGVDLYRVPADKAVFDPAGEGLFRPAPVPLARRTEADDAAALAATRALAARELDELLLQTLGALATPPASAYQLAEAAA
jgi:hypothetical protein